MEKPYGTFTNNTVSEHFRKMRFRYLTHSLCTPKMKTILEHFQKIRFRYLTPPSPLDPKMTLAISLWNIIKPHLFWNNNLLEPFRIILFRKVSERYAFVTYSLSLHPKNDDCFGTFTPPSPLHPKMALTTSLWNIIKPHPFWKNNLSEPFKIILFWKNTLLLPYSPPLPPHDPRYLINRTSECFKKIRFLNLTPPHCTPKMALVFS